MPARFRRTSHQARSASDTAPIASSAPTASPPSCHTRIPSTSPPMPSTDRTAPTRSMPRSPVKGTSLIRPIPDRTTRDDDQLEQEADAPREEGRDEPAEQRADGGRDGRGGADERVDALLAGALEVAVDERLHRGEQQRRAEAAEDGPEDDDRPQVLGEGHRQRADRVAEQAQDVGLLAPDQVADLAADQDERRRDEGLQGDRRLDAAHRGPEVGDDGRDRHVHQGRVDDQDEHRCREEQRETSIELGGHLRRRRGGGRHAAAVAAAGAAARARPRSSLRTSAMTMIEAATTRQITHCSTESSDVSRIRWSGPKVVARKIVSRETSEVFSSDRVLQQLAAEDRAVLVGGLEREEEVKEREGRRAPSCGRRPSSYWLFAQTITPSVAAAMTRPSDGQPAGTGRGRIGSVLRARRVLHQALARLARSRGRWPGRCRR